MAGRGMAEVGLRVGGIGEPGGDLLFRRLSGSTIGAEGFHGRVRDGIGCLAPRCGHQAGQAPWISKPPGFQNPLDFKTPWISKPPGFQNPLDFKTPWISKPIGRAKPGVGDPVGRDWAGPGVSHQGFGAPGAGFAKVTGRGSVRMAGRGRAPPDRIWGWRLPLHADGFPAFPKGPQP
jgi:hypothetical protein